MAVDRRHVTLNSFVLFIALQGFRKVDPDRWEFANDCFRRGEKRLLCDIHRRKVTPAAAATGAVTVAAAAAAIPMALPVGSPVYSGEEQVLSSSSSPEPPSLQHPPAAPSGSGSGGVASGDVGEENERLRRENARLARELGQMKKLCNNILLLMSKYAATQQQPDAAKQAAAAGNCAGEWAEAAAAAPPPLARRAKHALPLPEVARAQKQAQTRGLLAGMAAGVGGGECARAAVHHGRRSATGVRWARPEVAFLATGGSSAARAHST